MALLRFSSIAANVSMDPRIGPIQGVQPKAKAPPTNIGKKEFTSYTMDLTKKYIEINADYRS